jgi:hypothetical protein
VALPVVWVGATAGLMLRVVGKPLLLNSDMESDMLKGERRVVPTGLCVAGGTMESGIATCWVTGLDEAGGDT